MAVAISARPYFLQPRSSAQSVQSSNFRSVTYRHEGMYKGMGQPSSTDVINLPANTSVWDSTLGMMALQPGALSAYQFAQGIGPMGSAAAGPATTPTNYWPWIIGGGAVLLVLLMGGRR
jgi:hypothetical protein